MSLTVPTEAVVASPLEIRTHFPALERIHADHPVAYFDGPGGTQVPRHVVDAMTEYLFHHNANTHWDYPTSAETDACIEAAREALADFLGGAPDEIAFGANMTTLTFHLARALGRTWNAGDEVVTTELDHHANIAPWRALQREFGIRTRTAAMHPETGELDWDDFERCITERTRLVAIGAASNALGTISDVRRAVDLAHAAGALVFIDAVHLAAHAPIDVRALDCDFLACSAYKFYGPHIGVLYGKRDRIAALEVPRLDPAPDTPPERLETGTQNHEGIAGAAAAVDFIASLAPGGSRRERIRTALSAFHARGAALARRIWTGLERLDRVRLYGPAPDRPRTPTIAFVVDGIPSDEVARRLAARGIFVSHGDFYAATVVERLGLAPDGLVRVGCACYTTDDEVDRLLEGVRAICG
ncbi:MAG TPA: cysteine desulfurase-like protein [Longimicrobiales bacterium]